MYQNGMKTKLIKLEKFLSSFFDKKYFLCIDNDKSNFMKWFSGSLFLVNTKQVKFEKKTVIDADLSFYKDKVNFYFYFSYVIGDKDDIIIDKSKMFSEKQINITLYFKDKIEDQVLGEFNSWAQKFYDSSCVKKLSSNDYTKRNLYIVK